MSAVRPLVTRAAGRIPHRERLWLFAQSKPSGAPPVLPPEESWVSATDAWLERQAAKREEQARLEQAQRQPGESYRWPKGWREEILKRRRPGLGG